MNRQRLEEIKAAVHEDLGATTQESRMLELIAEVERLKEALGQAEDCACRADWNARMRAGK